jgi:hypothetical protein
MMQALIRMKGELHGMQGTHAGRISALMGVVTIEHGSLLLSILSKGV